jgi:hypothetical protein
MERRELCYDAYLPRTDVVCWFEEKTVKKMGSVRLVIVGWIYPVFTI